MADSAQQQGTVYPMTESLVSRIALVAALHLMLETATSKSDPSVVVSHPSNYLVLNSSVAPQELNCPITRV